MYKHGKATLDNRGLGNAPVFLVDRRGQVVSATRTGADGSYRLEVPAGCAGDFVLLKILEPIIGAVASSAEAERIDFPLRLEETVELQGTIRMPEGMAFDWANVSLTIKELPGLPPEVKPALLRNGVEPTSTSTFTTQQVKQPQFRLRVMPGRYRFEVDRWLYGQEPNAAVPPLELGRLVLTGGAVAQPAPIGQYLELSGDAQAEAFLVPTAP